LGLWWKRKGKNILEERGAAWWRETVEDLCVKELRGGKTIGLKWWLVVQVFFWIAVKATMGKRFGWREKGNRCCDLMIKGL
jgi:hypothetical protein